MAGIDIVFVGLLLALLLPMALIDLQQRRIPNLLNGAVAGTGLLHAIIRHPSWRTLLTEVAVAGLACAVFALTAGLMRLINRHAQIGWGDLKFLIAATFWVGIDGSIAILIVACLVHVVTVAAAAPWQGFAANRLRPFGPMLAVGALTVVVAVFMHQGAT